MAVTSFNCYNSAIDNAASCNTSVPIEPAGIPYPLWEAISSDGYISHSRSCSKCFLVPLPNARLDLPKPIILSIWGREQIREER